jgi:hypothetical protein
MHNTTVLSVIALIGLCGAGAAIAFPTGPAAAPRSGSACALPAESTPHVVFNQELIEGTWSTGIDMSDPDAVFALVFSRLPDEVVVYPTENYYYFKIFADGRQFWGNIRLPVRQRDDGVLSFAYFEFVEFPQLRQPKRGMSQSKYMTQADGVEVARLDHLTYTVTYEGRPVVFRLNAVPQETPALFPLDECEVFVEQTFDESGYRFFLLFNEERDYFLWVLNEEQGVPDVLEADKEIENLLIGRRSGFAFWRDDAHGGRKVLLAIRRLNSLRNDYFDGPFDQLADNWAVEAGISEYMQLAAPGLRGKIDAYGYYTDKPRPLRVALSCYYTYLSRSDLLKFLEMARDSEDMLQFISRRGRLRSDASMPAIAPGDTIEEQTGDRDDHGAGNDLTEPG